MSPYCLATVNEMCVLGGTFGGQRSGGAGAATGPGASIRRGAFSCRAVKSMPKMK